MPIERLPLDQNQKNIARDLGLSDDFMRILSMRGLATEQEIISFLRPSFDKMSSPFDIDGMKESKDKLRAITFTLRDRLIADGAKDCLLLGAGGCGVCERCSKLDGEPCKAPHLAIPGLEAYGVNVSKLAAAAGMKYINGVNTVTYFGAILFN